MFTGALEERRQARRALLFIRDEKSPGLDFRCKMRGRKSDLREIAVDCLASLRLDSAWSRRSGGLWITVLQLLLPIYTPAGWILCDERSMWKIQSPSLNGRYGMCGRFVGTWSSFVQTCNIEWVFFSFSAKHLECRADVNVEISTLVVADILFLYGAFRSKYKNARVYTALTFPAMCLTETFLEIEGVQSLEYSWTHNLRYSWEFLKYLGCEFRFFFF